MEPISNRCSQLTSPLVIFNFSQLSATITNNTIWHAGNDGSGSGLDADLLDGIQGASFVRNDVGSQQVQSYLTINNSGNFSVLEFVRCK